MSTITKTLPLCGFQYAPSVLLTTRLADRASRRGAGAATGLLGSLLSSLIKGPLGLDRDLSQGPDRRPIHFQLLIHPGEAQDERLETESASL